jgi:hypothetical protein
MLENEGRCLGSLNNIESKDSISSKVLLPENGILSCTNLVYFDYSNFWLLERLTHPSRIQQEQQVLDWYLSELKAFCSEMLQLLLPEDVTLPNQKRPLFSTSAGHRDQEMEGYLRRA